MPNIRWNLNPSDKEILFNHFPNGIIALDLETTGLSPTLDEIIEISAIKICPNESDIFETFLNPNIPIPKHTTDIHKITDEMVKDAPQINEILPQFLDFVGLLPIVAHNAKFDLGFIAISAQKLKLNLNKSPVFCSCKLARTKIKETKNHKLKTLVDYFNIPLVNHHRASDDAYAALMVFIQALRRTERDEAVKSSQLFTLDQFKVEQEIKLPPHLGRLEQLIKNAAVIEINYNGGSQSGKFRPIKLNSLLILPDGLFLYARCLLSDIYKSFKVSKIVDIRSPEAHEIEKWLKK